MIFLCVFNKTATNFFRKQILIKCLGLTTTTKKPKPFYERGNQDSKRLSNSPKLPLAHGGAGFRSQSNSSVCALV